MTDEELETLVLLRREREPPKPNHKDPSFFNLSQNDADKLRMRYLREQLAQAKSTTKFFRDALASSSFDQHWFISWQFNINLAKLRKIQYQIDFIKHPPQQNKLQQFDIARLKEIPIDKPMNGPYKKIFNYWQLSGLPSPKTNTKIYEKNVVALRRLFKSFSIDQIIQTIDRLKLAISPDYSPASLKSKEYYSKLYFSEFVLNERTGESIFNKLLETPPVPLKNSVAPVPDPDPNITTYIKTFYLEKILGNANVQLTVSDENVFRLTTQKLIKFHTDNQGKYPTPWFGVGDVARLYTDAITDYLDRFKNGNVRQWGINSFKWDDFFNKHLPAYMFDQAMLVKPSFKSPLNM